jgi:hypothetical protein
MERFGVRELRQHLSVYLRDDNRMAASAGALGFAVLAPT